MKSIARIELLYSAHQLIKKGQTGCPAEFARLLHVSERKIYRVLDSLKEMDAAICFSRNSNTYYYNEDFELLVNISVKVKVKEQLITIV